MKSMYIWSEEVKFSVCAWQTTKNVRTNKVSKFAPYKMNIQKSIAFLYTNKHYLKEKIRKKPTYNSIKVLRNKFLSNEGCEKIWVLKKV